MPAAAANGDVRPDPRRDRDNNIITYFKKTRKREKNAAVLFPSASKRVLTAAVLDPTVSLPPSLCCPINQVGQRDTRQERERDERVMMAGQREE